MLVTWSALAALHAISILGSFSFAFLAINVRVPGNKVAWHAFFTFHERIHAMICTGNIIRGWTRYHILNITRKGLSWEKGLYGGLALYYSYSLSWILSWLANSLPGPLPVSEGKALGAKFVISLFDMLRSLVNENLMSTGRSILFVKIQFWLH